MSRKQSEERVIRTTIMVPKNIAAELSAIAKSRGKTVFHVAGEGLKLTMELLKDGFEPMDLMNYWRLYKLLVSVDSIPIPMKFLEQLLNEVSKCSPDVVSRIYDMFHDLGKEVGTLIKVEFHDLGELISAVSKATKLVPVRQMDVRPIEGGVELVVIGPSGTTQVGTKALLSFIRGFVSQYGFEVTSEEYHMNILRVTIRRA